MAKRLQLGPCVVGGLTHVYERWDGMSTQRLAAGEAISLPMRVVQVAWVVGRRASPGRRGRSHGDFGCGPGRSLDPALAALAANDLGDLLSDLDQGDLGPLFLDAEPGDPLLLSGPQVDRALTCIADFGDLKSPHMVGHSRRVADVAQRAARAASMTPDDADLVDPRCVGPRRRSGRPPVQPAVEGRPAVPGRARADQAAQLFHRADLRGEPGAGAGQNTRRRTPRASGRVRLPPRLRVGTRRARRLLAAANSWCSLTETRPHRQSLTESEAGDALWTQVDQGLFGPQRRRGGHHLGRAARELDPARLEHRVDRPRSRGVATGGREQTNPAIAVSLGISPRPSNGTSRTSTRRSVSRPEPGRPSRPENGLM